MSGDRKPWGVFDRNGWLVGRHKTRTAAEQAARAGWRGGYSVRRIKPGETYESTRKPKPEPRRYARSSPRAYGGDYGRLAAELELGTLAAIAAAGLMGRRR